MTEAKNNDEEKLLLVREATCNHERMKGINTGAILTALSQVGDISRIELAEMLGLDAKTVTNIIRPLLKQKLVKSAGINKPVMGRPRELLRLNLQARQAIGIHLEPHRIFAGLVNLGGHLEYPKTVAVSSDDSQKVLLKKFRIAANYVLGHSVSRRLLGIGLAHHGIIDKNTGIVLQSARLSGWEGVNVYKFFEKEFGLDFAMKDSTPCKAMAEHWFGATKAINDFVLIDLGVGIGFTIFSSGRTLVGVSFSAGEIGHNVVENQGRLCKCGKIGCLETVASIPAIEEAFQDKLHLQKIVGFEEICRKIQQNNPDALGVIKQAGRYIGVALSAMVNVLNPGYLVICGQMLSAGTVLMQAINDSLREHTIRSSFDALKILTGGIGNNAAAVGAAMLLLGRIFKPAR